MRPLLQVLLAWLVRATLRRYRPKIVGVTGSVGKTSTKEAVFTVLNEKYRVRRSEKNYNTEIGVPLAILGISHHGRNVFGWTWAFLRAIWQVVVRDSHFPDILVLEMGADRPGDIAYLVRLAPPHVGVVTAIGEIPVHVEFFAGPEAIAREKTRLIEALPPDGHAVLNYDDVAIRRASALTRARIVSYGIGEGASARIRNYRLDGGGEAPGVRFEIAYRGATAPVVLKNAFGRQQAYAAAAAVCVGAVFGMKLEETALALRGYEPPPGRLKLLRGNKGALILDDTYNSSPAAMAAALEVLAEFPAERRIAVLGDMLELGVYTEAAHRAVGVEVVRVADVVIGVGERMKFALDEIHEGAADRRWRPPEQVFWFASADEAGRKVEELLRSGDVVLVKGSQGMRMERVVEEIMAEPERAAELLVRQNPEWLERS